MSLLRSAALVAVLCLPAVLVPWPAQAQAQTAAAPPKVYDLKEFFRSPTQSYYRLSEDGRTLSFMQPTGDSRRLNVFVQPLAGSRPEGEARQLTNETARNVDNYFWKGSRTILYQKDFGGDENYHVVAVDTVTGTITDLTPHQGVRASVADDLKDDPQHVLITHNRRDAQVFDVYRVDVRSGASTLVAQNPGNVADWTTDHAGRVRVAITSDGLDSTLLYRAKAEGEFRPIITTDYKTEVVPLFFTFDNRRLYALSNRGRDRKALVVIDPAKPDAEQLVDEHPQVDLAGADFSRVRKVLTSTSYQTDKLGQHFFDVKARALQAALEARLPGYQVTIQSATRAEDKFIVAASNDRTPGARYVYDAKAKSLAKLGELNPWIAEADMAPMKPITYQSRDGLVINGYLTLPVGREAKKLPCIVNPHGGPWYRDGWGYNPEIQFLANRGFCVLQMNFRGSTGYGRAFWEASFGQWGLKMQDDVSDGAAWLVAQGFADPKRIGIYGGSYGGYATLAGVAFTPELYAAAVDYVGVSNLFTFMTTIPPYWKPFLAKMYAMVGDPEKDKERLAATSPALQADKIRTPLFVAQGARDPRVNKAESDQMVDALKKRGVDVQYMVKDNEGHGFRNEENKFEFYEAMEQFLSRHLKRTD